MVPCRPEEKLPTEVSSWYRSLPSLALLELLCLLEPWVEAM